MSVHGIKAKGAEKTAEAQKTDASSKASGKGGTEMYSKNPAEEVMKMHADNFNKMQQES